MSLPLDADGVQSVMRSLEQAFARGGQLEMHAAAEVAGVVLIPIVGDEVLVDPTMGTGAVKVTPHHDANDRDCATRLSLPLGVPVFGLDGIVNSTFHEGQAGWAADGIDRLDARGVILSALEQQGLYKGGEAWESSVPLCSRSGDLIEPMWMHQWHITSGPVMPIEPTIPRASMTVGAGNT